MKPRKPPMEPTKVGHGQQEWRRGLGWVCCCGIPCADHWKIEEAPDELRWKKLDELKKHVQHRT